MYVIAEIRTCETFVKTHKVVIDNIIITFVCLIILTQGLLFMYEKTQSPERRLRN